MVKPKKPTKKTKSYLLAIRVYDEKFKEHKHEVFAFRSEKQRQSMIQVCEKNKIECMKTI